MSSLYNHPRAELNLGHLNEMHLTNKSNINDLKNV